MRKFLILLGVLGVLLGGCTSLAATKQVVAPTILVTSSGPIVPATPKSGEILVSPLIFPIKDAEPGVDYVWTITVKNGCNSDQVFSITTRQPNKACPKAYAATPYVIGTPEMSSWFTLDPTTLVVSSKGSASVKVTFRVPDNHASAPKDWSYWVAVHLDSGQFAQTEVDTWTLVSLKD